MTKNSEACKRFDLSSVKSIFTGAAPLGAETANDLQSKYPSWAIRQAYGKFLLEFLTFLKLHITIFNT
jgi:hypothetical protein